MDDQLTLVRPAPPPLRIHHLMACAAVATVQFTLWRVRHQTSLDPMAPGATMEALRQSLNAVGLTCALFSIYWYFKGYAGLSQPGQCLLMGHVFFALQGYLFVMLLRPFGPDIVGTVGKINSSWVLWLISSSVQAVILFGIVTYYGWCAWKVADTVPWRLTFLLLAMAALMIVPWSGISTRYGYSRIVAVMIPALVQGSAILLVEIWAGADDLFSRRARYWTHWVGIALSIAVHALSTVWCLINWFH